MKSLYILLAFCFLGFGQCFAQNIYVHNLNGQIETFSLIDVSSITFDDNVMNLNLITEDTVSWNFSQIDYYNYDQWYVSVQEGLVLGENGIRLYPNPAIERITVEFDLNAKSFVGLSILDMNGRTAVSTKSSLMNSGFNKLNVSIGELGLSSGTYIVRLEVGKSAFNKLLIIHD